MKQNEEAKGIEDIIFNVLLLVAIDLIQYVAKIDKKFQYKDNSWRRSMNCRLLQ